MSTFTKYPCHIEAVEGSMERLDPNAVRTLKTFLPRGAGVRYLDEPGRSTKTVVLRSESLHDILDVITNKRWSHSKMPTGIEAGTTVIVLPDAKQEEIYGEFSFGVRFKASAAPYRDEVPDVVWTSEAVAA